MQNVYPVTFLRFYKTGSTCGRWQRSEQVCARCSWDLQRWQIRDAAVRPAWWEGSSCPGCAFTCCLVLQMNTKINTANTWAKFETISSSYFLGGFFELLEFVCTGWGRAAVLFHCAYSHPHFKDFSGKIPHVSCWREWGGVRGFPLAGSRFSPAAVQKKPLCMHRASPFLRGVVSASTGQLPACQPAPERAAAP